MNELTLEASVDNLNQVLSFIDEHLEAMGCSMKKQMQVDVAVEELFVNIAHYAYGPGKGTAKIQVEQEDGTIVITLIDSGIPYNPLAKEDPDVTLSAAERQIGGLGIFMAKKNLDDIQYRYEDGKNILTLRKDC